MRELRAGATSSLGLAKANEDENGYHYVLSPIQPTPSFSPDGSVIQSIHEYAVISSDDVIRVFQPSDLAAGEGNAAVALGKHESVTCVAPFPGHVGGGWITGGRDGTIQHWDRRGSRGSNPVRKSSNKRKAPYLSIASDPNGHLWAAGTELTSHVAEVEIWDVRTLKEPIVTYVECHSDDVSVVSPPILPINLHTRKLLDAPSDPGTLLSGSTDGLVNVFASNFPSDEDDAVVQTINHGSSIHRAGFLPNHPFFSKRVDSAIYALSHDEIFAVYKRESAAELADEDEQMNDGDDEVPTESQARVWGDVRPMLNCEYVIDVIPDAQGAVVAVGSHSEKRIDLVPLRYKSAKSLRKSWKLREKPALRLEGAHGDEIVRSVAMFGDERGSTILTAGEDGLVKSWTYDSNTAVQDTVMEEGAVAEHATSTDGKGDARKRKRKRDRET